MSGEICADNRFKLIAKYKAKLIESTNIETSEDEMAVIDNILFRFWQMGWLDKLDTCENTCEITRKSNASDHHRQNIETYAHDMGVSIEQAEKELQLPSAGQIMTATSNTVVSDTVKIPVMDGTTERLSSAERTVAHIQDFTQYQIDWLTAHDDLELEPELESWVIRFLKDTADCYEKEYLTSAERKGKWIRESLTTDYPYKCSACKKYSRARYDYCPNCGADMRGE